VSERIDDTALMLRYRDGDVAAFEMLYRRHNDSLFRYLFRLSANRESAEDIYQEVWRKIIDSRKRYRATAKFTTFLYRVAHNSFIDYLRRNKRYATAEPFDPDQNPSNTVQPDDAAENLLIRRRLDSALRELPDEQREAFLLHEEAGLGLDVIAQITGANRETVKSRLRYATRKLRLALSDPALSADGMI
jgi:RNA polymerase sigma-70 factor (ECF subfamily)